MRDGPSRKGESGSRSTKAVIRLYSIRHAIAMSQGWRDEPKAAEPRKEGYEAGRECHTFRQSFATNLLETCSDGAGTLTVAGIMISRSFASSPVAGVCARFPAAFEA